MNSITRPLSGDLPLTQRETENIGYAAEQAMRRAECAVRNWHDAAYHQVFNNAWVMIEDLYEELIFFCPSPPHVQLFSDWMTYNRVIQVRHVNEVMAAHEIRRHQMKIQDHLANARQRRAGLGRRLAEVRIRAQRDREAEQYAIALDRLRRGGTSVPSHTASLHRDRIAAWQKEAAAVRMNTPIVPPVSIHNGPTATNASSPTANAPISVEAFSAILNSGSGTTVTNNPPAAYQATVEDATDEEFALPIYRHGPM
jgi:hypothetical protein